MSRLSFLESTGDVLVPLYEWMAQMPDLVQ